MKYLQKETPFGKIAYYLSDYNFIKRLNTNQIFEQELVFKFLSEVVKQSKYIVDIGSHAGSHTVLYKYLNPTAFIHAIEPQYGMFKLLEHNVKINNFKDIKIYNTAIANIEGETTLCSQVYDSGIDRPGTAISYEKEGHYNYGGVQIGPGGEVVKVATLDNLNLGRIDYIKIDAEGTEPLILIGGEKTIRKYKPVIFFEQNQKTMLPSVIKEFNASNLSLDSVSILKSYGYTNVERVDNSNFLAIY